VIPPPNVIPDPISIPIETPFYYLFLVLCGLYTTKKSGPKPAVTSHPDGCIVFIHLLLNDLTLLLLIEWWTIHCV